MTVKFSISLTNEQDAFARQLVQQGRFSSVSAVIQQGLDLLRHKTEADQAETEALKPRSIEQRHESTLFAWPPVGLSMPLTLVRAAMKSRRGFGMSSAAIGRRLTLLVTALSYCHVRPN